MRWSRDEAEADRLRVLMGRTCAAAVRAADIRDLHDAEFSVYSQFGEDGILQYLIHAVGSVPRTFMEIGVQDYTECNSRFLVATGWSGLVVDAGADHIATIEAAGFRWKYGVEAIQAWVTPDNVGEIIGAADEDLGVFSLDVDGVDYWIVKALPPIRPAVIVVEYNSIFGPTAAVTVPFRPDFDRAKAHPSNLYYGASLAALATALGERGYDLVGSNSAGNNAFFVDGRRSHGVPVRTPQEAYVASRFRESRNDAGDLTYLAPHVEGRALIADLPVVDVLTEETITVGEAVER